MLDSNSYNIRSMERIMSNSVTKKRDSTQASKIRKDRKGFFLLSFQAQCLAMVSILQVLVNEQKALRLGSSSSRGLAAGKARMF